MAEPLEMPRAPSDRPLVLIAEDEVLVRMLISDILQDAGFKVIEAKDATEALRVLEARPDVHVLVTDAEMPPGPTGMELAHQVCERWPFIEIILSSGRVRPGPARCPSALPSCRSRGLLTVLLATCRRPQIERWRASKYSMRYHEIVEGTPQKPTPPSAGIRKPIPPMSPSQSHAKAEKNRKAQAKIRDTKMICAKKGETFSLIYEVRIEAVRCIASLCHRPTC